jgi:endonuclease V-like protein UPF0215 family
VKEAISHVIGFDDAPFQPHHRGDVLVVGSVFCGSRLEGVLCGKVRRDGANATSTLVRLVSETRFRPHLQAVLLQGIALAGFNVIDLQGLSGALDIPVIAISRRAPQRDAIKRALLDKVPGGRRKWKLIERAGPMEALGGVYVQRVGIDAKATLSLIKAFAVNSSIPEPLRTAHLIAAGVTLGESRHRV